MGSQYPTKVKCVLYGKVYQQSILHPYPLLIGIALRNVCSLKQAKHCGVLFFLSPIPHQANRNHNKQ
jgi:hypothetical protein